MSTAGRVLAVLPGGLVPLAWGFTAAVAAGAVERRTLVIGLGVMTVLFAAFAIQPSMSGPVLGDWRLVIAGGAVTTLFSLVVLVVAPWSETAALSAFAWMLLPAPALVRTGRAVGATRRYAAFAALSVLGAVVVGVALLTGRDLTLAGIALVGIGQTGSILDAVARNGAAPLGGDPGEDATL